MWGRWQLTGRESRRKSRDCRSRVVVHDSRPRAPWGSSRLHLWKEYLTAINCNYCIGMLFADPSFLKNPIAQTYGCIVYDSLHSMGGEKLKNLGNNLSKVAWLDGTFLGKYLPRAFSRQNSRKQHRDTKYVHDQRQQKEGPEERLQSSKKRVHQSAKSSEQADHSYNANYPYDSAQPQQPQGLTDLTFAPQKLWNFEFPCQHLKHVWKCLKYCIVLYGHHGGRNSLLVLSQYGVRFSCVDMLSHTKSQPGNALGFCCMGSFAFLVLHLCVCVCACAWCRELVRNYTRLRVS